MIPNYDEHGEYLCRRHFGSLDGVRCIAILAVLWHHADLPFAESFPRLFARGFLGVDLFFVLSGFLIVTLLLREKDRRKDVSLSKFYWRRTLRIFPPYYALLALLSFVYLARPRLNTATEFYDCLPYYLTYTSNWSVHQAANLAIMWSLATEEQFYIVWPAIEKYLKPKLVYIALFAVIVVNQLINFGVLDGALAWLYGTEKVPHLPILDSTFTPIAFGAALAHLLNSRGGFAFFARGLNNRYSPWPLLTAIVLLTEVLPEDLSGWPRLTLHLLMVIWLASLVIREDHSMRTLLAARPIAYIGAISYGIYLYHLWVFHAVRTAGNLVQLNAGATLFAAQPVATVAFAALSFEYFERPFLKLKDKFALAS